MTEQTFQFDLVSPEKNVISASMAHVVIPGESGEIGVGAGHEKYVVALKKGTIKMFKNNMSEAPQVVEIDGGFADITNDQCTVLASTIVTENDAV